MNHRVRIAHILPWPAVGGTEHATLRIARAVDNSRFHSLAFYNRDAVCIREFFESACIETVPVEFVEPSYRQPRRFLRASLCLAREFRERRIDIVHCSELLAAHYTTVAGRLAGLPVLAHIRSIRPEISNRDKSFLLPVSRFAFVSQAAWRDFALRVPPKKGCVIYDGIEIPPKGFPEEAREGLRGRWNIPPGTAVVGMISRIAPPKDHRTLIQAARSIVDVLPGVRFLIVGDYSGTAETRACHAELVGLLHTLSLEEHFIFTGFQTDVRSFIDLCDVVVLSTHNEGLPLVILEAMAQAKPVIATNVGGVAEAVVHDQTGLLVSRENVTELTERILSLLRNPCEARRLGQAGQQLCRDKFSVKQFSESMSALYEDMVNMGAAWRRP